MSYIISNREKRDITPEEVLSDAYGEVALRLEHPIERRRVFVFAALLAVGVFVVLVRMIWLGVVYHKPNLAVAEANRTRNVPLPAPRGIIYDRTGQQLVHNAPVSDLVTDPKEFPSGGERRLETAHRLSAFLGLADDDRRALEEKLLATSSKSVLVAEYLTHATSVAFSARENEFKGIVLRATSSRKYLGAVPLYHVLGHVGRVTPEDIEAGYIPSDLVGKVGLEASYEKILKGEAGAVLYEVNARGEALRVLSRIEPRAGKHIVLTLDGRLQRHAFEKLGSSIRARRSPGGAIVALDARNGNILALASFPSVDGTMLSQGLSREAYETLLAQPGDPFFNRAIAARYPAGSTIKPFMGAAALTEGIVTPATVVDDRGAITVPDIYVRGKVYTFRGYASLGPVNILSAIALSSDIYFYTVGGGYGGVKGLGVEKIGAYMRQFGFGERLGVDIPGEGNGLVPTPTYKKERTGEEWRIGDTYNISIGQGDFGVTPLQLAAATAAIANGGTLWRPRLADRLVDTNFAVLEEFQPEAIRSDIVPMQHIETIRKSMRATVQYGTAKLLQQLPVTAAAKTGTAQTGRTTQHHALVTVFAPYENPEIVLAIIIEKSGEGSDVAVPLARDILQEYFEPTL